MPAQASSSTTDFVQDYAAKRAAQIERARKLREDRQIQQQQQQPGVSLGNPIHSTVKNNNSASPAHRLSGSLQSVAPSAPGALTASPTRRIVHLVEDDFKRATKAGIITPDQARQLWAMLSEQIVHVGNSTTPLVSSMVSSTAPSNDADLAVSSSGHGAQTVTFRGSISMDSLRASIAQFKEQQRQKQFSAKSHATHSSGHVDTTAEDVYETSTRKFAPTGTHAASGTTGASTSRVPRRELYADSGEQPLSHPHSQRVQHQKALEDDGMDDTTLHRGIHVQKGRREKFKPAWNFDVDVGYADPSSDAQESPSPKAQLKQTQQPPKRVPTKRTVSGAHAGAVATPQSRGGNSAITAPSYASRLDEPPAFAQLAQNVTKNRAPMASVAPTGGIMDIDNMVVGASGNSNVPEGPAKEPLLPCGHCGRTFRASVVARHEKACQQLHKKRRAFDVKGMRMDGIEGIHEAQATAQPNLRKRQAPQAQQAGKIPKWKIQHEQFQAAMRAMKQMEKGGSPARGGFASGAGMGMGMGGKAIPPPAPLPEAYDDRVPCPHCGRKFAELAAERHIPMCAKTIAKPKGIRPTRR